jgi:hypothetical protein
MGRRLSRGCARRNRPPTSRSWRCWFLDKVEHSNPRKELSDEQLEAMVEYLKASLEAQAGGSVRVIEGTIEPAAAMAPTPTPKNRLMLEVDTAIGPLEHTQRKVRPPPGA